MIIEEGRFYLPVLRKQLKNIDPDCLINAFHPKREGTDIIAYPKIAYRVEVIPSSQDKEANLLSAIRDHDVDAIILELTGKRERVKNAAGEIRNIPGWATWTAQEAVDYIDTEVVNLATAKKVLKNMARMICYLRDHGGVV